MSVSAKKQKSQWVLDDWTQHCSKLCQNNDALKSKDSSKWPPGESLPGNSSGLKDEIITMSVSAKKQKSQWDSELCVNNDAQKSKDSSEWPSWGSLPGNSGDHKDNRINEDFNNIPETVWAQGGDNSCGMNRSSGSDGWEQWNSSRSPENFWSQSHRGKTESCYQRQNQSRSQNRIWSQSRSRSPAYDLKWESYCGIDRSRSGSGVSSRPCRDFAAGRCRRGSQCWFVHLDSLNNKDGGHSDTDPAESWETKQECRGASRYPYSEGPRDYVQGFVNACDWEKDESPRKRSRSTCDREKDESLRKHSRSTISCNDFRKGKCHRGSSCRFVHHGASGDRHDRSDRNAPFDHEYKHEQQTHGSTPCKYFEMGKCRDGDSCRFLHGVLVCGNPEKSQDRRLDPNVKVGGAKWSDINASLEIANSAGWGNHIVGNINFTDSAGAEKSTNDKRGQTLVNKNRPWEGPKWKDKAGGKDECWSSKWETGNSGADMGVPESTDSVNRPWDGPTWKDKAAEKNECWSAKWETGNSSADITGVPESTDSVNRAWEDSTSKDKAAERVEHCSSKWETGNSGVDMGIPELSGSAKLFDKEEPPCMCQASASHTLNVVSVPVHEPNIKQEASGLLLSAAAMSPKLSEDSYTEQHLNERREDNVMPNHGNSRNEVNALGNDMRKFSVPGQSCNRDGDNSGSLPLSSFGETSQSQQMLSLHSSTTEKAECNVSQITSGIHGNLLSRKQVAKITSLSVSLGKIIGNKQQLPQTYAALNPPYRAGLVPSLPNSLGLVPPFSAAAAQSNLATTSQKQNDSMVDSIESCKPDSSIQAPRFFLMPVEQKSPTSSKCISPSSISVGPNSGKPHRSGGTEEYHLSPKLKQQEPIAKSVIKEHYEMATKECRQEQQNGNSENLDAVGAEEGNRSKDEKEVRIFRIALVEFVKEILKPTWKEGKLSREVHKTIVKKVVDKVAGAIQGVHIPKTQEQIEHYLSYSKSKLTKLVQAYVEKYLKS